jgi:hypothetical protein
MMKDLPVALAASTFLDRRAICVDMTGLGEVSRQPVFSLRSPVRDAGMVTVSELVRASHCLVSV